MPSKVKICGVTREEDVKMAADEGCDAVGFITGFPESPRNLSIDRARELLKRVPVFVQRVVVASLNSPGLVEKVCRELRPDALQLYGDLSLINHTLFGGCRPRLIGVFHAAEDGSVKPSFDASFELDAVLLDTYSGGMAGGTGRIHDWRLSLRVKEAVQPLPFILSGGLNPDNIAEAVKLVKPYAVDASSGVEVALGVKDRKKVRRFVRGAKGLSD